MPPYSVYTGLDWSPLNMAGDPLPGNPAAVSEKGRAYLQTGINCESFVANCNMKIRGGTISLTVDHLMDWAFDIQRTLKIAGQRYQEVGTALITFATALDSSQRQLVSRRQQAEDKVKEICKLKEVRDSQQSALIGLQNQPEYQCLLPADAERVKAQRQGEISAKQNEVNSTQRQIEGAEKDLKAIIKAAQADLDQYDADARTARDRIQGALFDRLRLRNFADNYYNFTHSKAFVSIRNGVSTFSHALSESIETVSNAMSIVSLGLVIVGGVATATGIGAPLGLTLFSVAGAIGVADVCLKSVQLVTETVILNTDDKGSTTKDWTEYGKKAAPIALSVALNAPWAPKGSGQIFSKDGESVIGAVSKGIFKVDGAEDVHKAAKANIIEVKNQSWKVLGSKGAKKAEIKAAETASAYATKQFAIKSFQSELASDLTGRVLDGQPDKITVVAPPSEGGYPGVIPAMAGGSISYAFDNEQREKVNRNLKLGFQSIAATSYQAIADTSLEMRGVYSKNRLTSPQVEYALA